MGRPGTGKGNMWAIVWNILKVPMLFCTQYNVIGSEITCLGYCGYMFGILWLHVWDIVVTCLGHFECTD